MRGSMITFTPGKGRTLREFDREPKLEELQDAVGGYIENVPYFTTISYGGAVLNCKALCNEYGKNEHMPINEAATKAWEWALQRQGIELRDQHGVPKDWLAGPVIVLFGDQEFMESL